METGSLPGALVISLDFELHWGVRHARSEDDPAVRGARDAVPALLALFQKYGVSATWAVVGFLFAGSHEDLERWRPPHRPRYLDSTLDPYRQPVGADEQADPVHFGRSLVDLIREAPGQEVGSHTYSHYFCLEPGQDETAFRCDLESAKLAAAEAGVTLESLVFPWNQHNPAYDRVVREAGFVCVRGNRPSPFYRARSGARAPLPLRVGRLLDSYVPVTGAGTVRWEDLRRPGGLCSVPASFFLRPHVPGRAVVEGLQRRRIRQALEEAAARSEIVHLWWHPHNFGTHLRTNLESLEVLLQTFDRLRRSYGMASLSMGGVAKRVGRGG